MKRFFNMVEVVLALGVTAIGIAGLMAIIPVSLNASRDAVADSFVSDIANTQFSIYAVTSKKNFDTAFNEIPNSAGEPEKWIPEAEMGENGVKFGVLSADGKCTVSVGRNGKLPDFSGDIRIWKWVPGDVFGMVNSPVNIIRVYIEVSWPASMDYANREKRTFVREFYKPNFAIPQTL